MNIDIKKIAGTIAPLTDLILLPLVGFGGLVLKFFRVFGAKRLPLSRELLFKIGVFPIKNHYYEPHFRGSDYKVGLKRDLPGIKLNDEFQLNFIKELSYANEILDIDMCEPFASSDEFKLGNGSFESGDAEFLYQFVRKIKPKKILEIGSGNSTKLVCRALKNNELLDGVAAQHICVEPFEMPWLENLPVKLVRKKIEECDYSLFESLEKGDLLFIDSSHIIRPQGDVLFEYLTILPRLKPGVYIHIHDIFTPNDYIDDWIVKDVKFWNEQYLVEAILSNSDRYEVVAALNYLSKKYFDQLKNVCPYLTKDRNPGSMYIRVAY